MAASLPVSAVERSGGLRLLNPTGRSREGDPSQSGEAGRPGSHPVRAVYPRAFPPRWPGEATTPARDAAGLSARST